jgi:hypothetical protein
MQRSDYITYLALFIICRNNDEYHPKILSKTVYKDYGIEALEATKQR